MKEKLRTIKNIMFDWRLIIALGVLAFAFMKVDEIINGQMWTALTWIGFGIWMYIVLIVVAMIVAMIFIFLKNQIIKFYIFIKNQLSKWQKKQ